jgi:uncharacterized protein
LRYIFDWDPQKAKINRQKHRGISFDRAATIFDDPEMISIFDEDHSEDEDRWITLGIDSTGSLLVVVHTFDAVAPTIARLRIISARKANQLETQTYQEA